MACRNRILRLSKKTLSENIERNFAKYARRSLSVWLPPNSFEASNTILHLNFNDQHFHCKRDFFNFPGRSISKRKEYAGRKLVGFSMEEMFSVVADVENYKNFVPFCKRSNITVRKENFLRGELEIGFPPIVESYVSNVTLIKPHLVKADCVEGKLFDHLTTSWTFNPGLKSNERSCVINFTVSFEFKSLLHSQLAHMFFNELVRQMESAFFEEAKQRYGKPTIMTTKLPLTTNKS